MIAHRTFWTRLCAVPGKVFDLFSNYHYYRSQRNHGKHVHTRSAAWDLAKRTI